MISLVTEAQCTVCEKEIILSHFSQEQAHKTIVHKFDNPLKLGLYIYEKKI